MKTAFIMSNDKKQNSLEQCRDEWTASLGIPPDDVVLVEEQDVHLSLDLREATYLMPFELLEENVRFMDQTMEGFPPWECFSSLFSSFERDIDMGTLADKGYYEGPEIVTNVRGSFMGDGLSFIHLSLMLIASVRATYSVLGIKRPYGQSVGDDLILLKTKLNQCLDLLQLLEALGCQFSKLNSISNDSATFCEAYLAAISDLTVFNDLTSMKNSIFKELAYLDTIKGSVLSGNSKVKIDRGDPFLGHAHMLNKQISYHPNESVKERSKVFLWANNYMSAHRLGSSMASLPTELGGVDLAVGPTISFESPRFQDLHPYYEAMLGLESNKFLQYFTLLQGIYRANPKGFKWSNDYELIKTAVEGCEILEYPNIDPLVPEWMLGEPAMKKLNYIQNELGLLSFRHLSGHLARQEAFLNCWEGKIQKTYMTFLSKDSKQRANAAWGVIKSNLEPVATESLRYHNFNALKHAFSQKTWGLYVRKDDPSLLKAFAGMPTLTIDFRAN